ncbi:MAG: peptidoglycan-binding domain-containing protein, partial [Candidatus Taylorbacteria bacterium]|nr:peptidoglycan-binding domain-containing protein [Candidatus Taylorbacteria bacterium]
SSNSFTRTLKQGMVGNDVKQLQIFLNSQGFTVAKSGVGSQGKETTYFGPATKAALMRFQLAHKKEILEPQGLIAPTGFFGEGTMNAVKGMGKQ